jgi:3-hydroxyisobutyrate dehydrogenase-like beta-hydroxyacid dehydrogenase
MSEISTLGLGLMGSALARAFVEARRSVTVWNRSPAKAQALVQSGASAANSVSAAVAASPVVLICIDSYETTQALFATPDVVKLLPGRIIVQLTTGSPNEARNAAAWFSSHEAQYLDGAILGGPANIATPRAMILYSGSRELFDRCKALLGVLGSGTRFVGANIGAAAAIDMAWLARHCGTYAGVAHGAAICEAEGADLEIYAALFAESDTARSMIDIIRKGAFANPPATLSVWHAALRRLQEQARDTGISSEVPDLVASIMGRAAAAGFGEEHVAAIVKVLRKEQV